MQINQRGNILITILIVLVSLSGVGFYIYMNYYYRDDLLGVAEDEKKSENNLPEDSAMTIQSNNQTSNQQKTSTENVPLIQAKVVEETHWGSIDFLDYYYEIGNDKWKEVYPCNFFDKDGKLTATSENESDPSFSISKYSALYTDRGTIQEKQAGVTNKKTISIKDSSLTFELDEVHLQEPTTYKTMCTFDGKCYQESDWVALKINGYETKMAVEEVKTLKFDNGLKFNFGVLAGGDDFCIRVI